jgi:hypothetical protein
MEKKEIKSNVYFDFNWSYGVEIKKIKEDLDELEKLGVTDILFKAEECYGESTVVIEAFTKRIETDEEFKKRIDIENQRQEYIRQRELAELERIKSKYGL